MKVLFATRMARSTRVWVHATAGVKHRSDAKLSGSAEPLRIAPQLEQRVVGGLHAPSGFAVLNANQHALAVDVADLERQHFANSQPACRGGLPQI